MEPTHDEAGARPPRAVRLLVRLTADGVELVRRDVVLMTPLPTQDIGPDLADRSGSRVELQAATGQVLYRRTGLTVPDRHAEIYTGDPELPFQRSVTPPIGSLFSLVVPELPAAQDVVLFGASPRPDDTTPAGSQRRSSRFAAPAEQLRVPLYGEEAVR